MKFKEVIDWLSYMSSAKSGMIFENLISPYILNQMEFLDSSVNEVIPYKKWEKKWGGTDTGTDIIIKLSNDKIVAVQAKFRSSIKKNLTKKDIDSFIADTSRKDIHLRIIITSAKNLSTNALKTVKNTIPHLEIINYSQIESLNINWTKFIDEYFIKSKDEKVYFKCKELFNKCWENIQSLPYENINLRRAKTQFYNTYKQEFYDFKGINDTFKKFMDIYNFEMMLERQRKYKKNEIEMSIELSEKASMIQDTGPEIKLLKKKWRVFYSNNKFNYYLLLSKYNELLNNVSVVNNKLDYELKIIRINRLIVYAKRENKEKIIHENRRLFHAKRSNLIAKYELYDSLVNLSDIFFYDELKKIKLEGFFRQLENLDFKKTSCQTGFLKRLFFILSILKIDIQIEFLIKKIKNLR